MGTLIGHDGSATSERALSELTPAGMLKSGNRPLREKACQTIQTWIEEKAILAAQRLGRKRTESSHAVLLGKLRHAIHTVSRGWKVDCIFFGPGSLKAVDRFLIGTVSSAVAEHAPSSAEIVRKDHGLLGGKPA